MFAECQIGRYYTDKEKELLKGRYLYKRSGRMGGCGLVYVSRNADNLERFRVSFSLKQAERGVGFSYDKAN